MNGVNGGTPRRAARSLAPREERRRALRGGAPPVMAGPVPFTPARGGSSVGARAGLLALLACHGFSAGAAWGTAGGNSWMRESAIDLAVRQASDLRVPEEHGVSPMGAIDEGLGVVGRRLSGGSPVLCPTQQASGGAIQNDQSPYGEVTLTSPDGTVSLYDDVAGYASSLFCQWHIKPPGGTTSQLSLVFDKFDVPVGFDMLRVYQLKCTSNDEGDPSICKRRQRTLMLSFPTSFDEAGMLPPLVHMQESNGVPVHLTIRFTSRFASQSAGFVASRRRHVRRGHPAWIHRRGLGRRGGGRRSSVRTHGGPFPWRQLPAICLPAALVRSAPLLLAAPNGFRATRASTMPDAAWALHARRYTSEEFDMMDASPLLMPQRVGTEFSVSGAGFDSGSELLCRFQGINDATDATLVPNDGENPVVQAFPPTGRCVKGHRSRLTPHMARRRRHRHRRRRLTRQVALPQYLQLVAGLHGLPRRKRKRLLLLGYARRRHGPIAAHGGLVRAAHHEVVRGGRLHGHQQAEDRLCLRDAHLRQRDALLRGLQPERLALDALTAPA